jgi:hypothetical protein
VVIVFVQEHGGNAFAIAMHLNVGMSYEEDYRTLRPFPGAQHP